MIKLLTLLQKPQFKLVTGNYIGFFDPMNGLADPKLAEIWTQTFNRGESEYFLEPKPVDPE